MRRYLLSLLLLAAVGCGENRVPQQQVASAADSTPAVGLPSPEQARGNAESDSPRVASDTLRTLYGIDVLRGYSNTGALRSHNLKAVASQWTQLQDATPEQNPQLQESWTLVRNPFACEDLLTGANSASFLPCAQLVGQPWRMEVEPFPGYEDYPDSLYTLRFPDSTILPFRRVFARRDPSGKPLDAGRMDLISCDVFTPQLPVRGGLRVGSHRRDVVKYLRQMVYPMLEFDNLILISDYQEMYILEFHLRADTVFYIRSNVYQG